MSTTAEPRKYPAAEWSNVTLEPLLGLLQLQPSMEDDKKLCKASIVDSLLGHAASTLAQSIGMDQDNDQTMSLRGCRNSLCVPPSLSFFVSFFLPLLLLGMTDVCSTLFHLIPRHVRAKIDFLRKKAKPS